MGLQSRRKKKGTDYVFEEIMAKNVSNLEKETYIQIQEAQRVPSEINLDRHILRYNKKWQKLKLEKVLKAAREK